MTYLQGHIKHGPDGEAAVRTQFPEGVNAQLDALAWVIATPTRGTRHAASGDVEGWADLFTPEAP